MNQALQDKLKTLPRTPGVYFHKSASGEVIYVGKAAVLKNRVRQYFQDSRGRDNKTMTLARANLENTDVHESSELQPYQHKLPRRSPTSETKRRTIAATFLD